MAALLKYLPDLTRPGNEWLTLVKLAGVIVAVIIDVFTQVDFTSPEGITAGIILFVTTLTARAKSYGAETVAEMDDREMTELIPS